MQAEEVEDDVGAAGIAADELFESIENEHKKREETLEMSYPFALSDDGEVISFRNCRGDCLAGSYLASLIASQIGDGSDLELVILSENGLKSEIIRRMRSRVCQMIGTIALAGRTSGPAASVGWPREPRETIIEAMSRALKRGFPVPVRSDPNYTVLAGAKDDGVDVVAWEYADRPPSPLLWFGQIATGRNWHEKLVILDAQNFVRDFLHGRYWNSSYATVIPFNLDDNSRDTRALHHRHGHILDRMSLMLKFEVGLDLISGGIEMYESENIHIALEWVDEFIQKLRDEYGTT